MNPCRVHRYFFHPVTNVYLFKMLYSQVSIDTRPWMLSFLCVTFVKLMVPRSSSAPSPSTPWRGPFLQTLMTLSLMEERLLGPPPSLMNPQHQPRPKMNFVGYEFWNKISKLKHNVTYMILKIQPIYQITVYVLHRKSLSPKVNEGRYIHVSLNQQCTVM